MDYAVSGLRSYKIATGGSKLPIVELWMAGSLKSCCSKASERSDVRHLRSEVRCDEERSERESSFRLLKNDVCGVISLFKVAGRGIGRILRRLQMPGR